MTIPMSSPAWSLVRERTTMDCFGQGDGVTEGFAGDDGAFAPLAIAAKDEVFGGGIEDFDLFGEWLEIEHFPDPFRGFEGIRD